MLALNQFGVNLGFYMVLPYLAVYLADDLGFSAALVGLVLGLRMASQQGLFLVGGTLADRLGPRPVIIAGCATRVVAFGLLAASPTAAAVVTATLLTGVAGALFVPGLRAFVSAESPGRRAEAFAVFEGVGHVGTLVGPLVGAVLLAVDFRVSCLVAAAVFAVLTLAQLLVLPATTRPPRAAGVLRDLRGVATNRAFLLLALFGSAYLALFNQLYLAIPLEARRVTGTPAATSLVFVVATALTILLPVRLTRWARRRSTAGGALATGVAAMGLGFVPPAVGSPLVPTADHPLAVPDAVVALLPILVGTAVLSAGVALSGPFIMELLPVVGSERLVGTYYGAFFLVSAVATTVLGGIVGGLLDLGAPWRWAPFATLAAAGLAGGAGIALLQRSGRLAGGPAPARGLSR